jgi:hypothetical protein
MLTAATSNRADRTGAKPATERNPAASAATTGTTSGGDAVGLTVLGVHLAGQPGDVVGQRIHNDSRQKVLDERFATCRRSGVSHDECRERVQRHTVEGAASWSPVVPMTRWRSACTLSPRRSAAIATLESRISPRLWKRFAVARDHDLKVAAELVVERRL